MNLKNNWKGIYE